jgi:hypothetical protein
MANQLSNLLKFANKQTTCRKTKNLFCNFRPGIPGIPGNPGPPGPQPDIQPFLNQLQDSSGREKGPTPFTYMQATVGPPGPRGPPGTK